METTQPDQLKINGYSFKILHQLTVYHLPSHLIFSKTPSECLGLYHIWPTCQIIIIILLVLKRYIIKGKHILYSIQRIIIAIAIAHATNCILFLLSLPAKIYLRTKLELKSHESSTIIINVCETRLLISHKTLDNLTMHHGKTIHFRPCNTEEK